MSYCQFWWVAFRPHSCLIDCRIVGEQEGLTPQGQVEIELHRWPGHSGETQEAFWQELESIVTSSDAVASPELGDTVL